MENIQKALELWVELTGIDPNSNKYRMRDWHIQSINEELKESLVLDESLFTTILLLESFATDYLESRSFSVNEMIKDYDSVLSYLEKSKDLYSILHSEEVTAKKEEFKTWMKEALQHYGVTNEKVYEMAESSEALGFLRRDALRSIENLQIHQFSQGKTSEQGAKYVTKVHEFWNINSLVRSMYSENTLSGVSLNLIRDPMDTSSYFTFAIKNGETLSLLTDKPNYSHPLQKYMSRRPGRDMSERMAKHHFPYDLLDIEFDRRGDAYVSPKNTKELVIYQDELHPLKEIKELEPDEVIWIVMMFSLIDEKFWKKDFKTKELSYTGEMTKTQGAITGAGNTALVVQDTRTVQLPTLTTKDVSTENMISEWDYKPTKQNQWLEERYEGKVSEEVLNLTGNNTTLKLLTSSSELKEMTIAEYEKSTSFMNRDKHDGVKLQKFDPTIFGNKEEIVKHQRWVARYNKAVVISNEAKSEYNERVKEIQKDYFSRIKANEKALFHAIALGVFEAPAVVWGEGFGHKEEYEQKNILHIGLEKDRSYHDSWGSFKLSQVPDYNHRCYVTGGKPIIVASFKPTTAEALALLCGCEVKELPDILQHWNKADLYSGNQILSNVDPMEWALENPWKKQNFNIDVFLSKSAYNQIRKDAGLPPNKVWLESK
ncbi:hypothetical protein CVD28_03530 [Bacillus sp. M6-12]|uniref:hypothetical protein n=1 Tax=Bacillus sp. M6-12 TaxID=2054166 RepID=UPI000C78296C|nr:hypothetical protein [Bacillus sp. M6-12]PLS19500.1 hypothetical protein CVD28_03530 [Bacillus sp. M6-12]